MLEKSGSKSAPKAAVKAAPKAAAKAAPKAAVKAPAKAAAKAPAKAAAPKKAPAKKAPVKAAPKKKPSQEAMLARIEEVRLLQREEGNFDCFARAVSGFCDQGGCMYHAECLSVSRVSCAC